MKITLYKDNDSVVILNTFMDYSNTEGYLVIDEDKLPNEPQEVWDIINNKLVISKEKQKAYLVRLKQQKKQQINLLKQQAEYSNITYKSYEIQADADSQSKLSSAVLLCQAMGINSYDWWSADNKLITFSIQELTEIGFLIAQRSASLVAKGRVLKDALKKAKTKEEIENIKWEANDG
ncbi:MAG: DUF4376 domain-containing protein [Campylobacteraceae bacterium]|jgi:hypothetical protein|nr:DUF4376 domain-containing protein [Campylobacteraceae bacterium]